MPGGKRPRRNARNRAQPEKERRISGVNTRPGHDFRVRTLLAGLQSLGPTKLAALGAVGLGMLAMFALLALSGGHAPTALLYGDLDLAEAAQMTDQLQAEHIPYRLSAGGHAIFVASPEVPRARLLLAAKGLPRSGSVGYEIFDHLNGLTTSQFVETIDQTRALEGELERTIDQIEGVRSSRVNLVLPSRAPFAAERQPAQASVLLTMQGANELDGEGVAAILNLVAAAVPGLKPDHISIVDARGELLTRPGGSPGVLDAGRHAEAVRVAVAERLSRAVESMLDRTLGADAVRATASVAMNFDRTRETSDQYDPNGQVALSEQSVDNTSTNSRSSHTVTVQNKLPGAATAGPTNGSTTKRHEETTNYDISHSVHTLVHDQPAITRISIAVLVNWKKVAEANGKTSWQPRSAHELAAITALVKSAIGFEAKRGDLVEVENMRFAADQAEPAHRAAPLFGVHLSHAEVMQLAETLLLGMIGVLSLLLVVKPMVLRLSTLGPALPGDEASEARSSAAAVAHQPAPLSAGLLSDQSMGVRAQTERPPRVSPARRVAGLVGEHPAETLAIIRGWMAKDTS